MTDATARGNSTVEPDERIELLDGYLVPTRPIGKLHWIVHARLARYLATRFPANAPR